MFANIFFFFFYIRIRFDINLKTFLEYLKSVNYATAFDPLQEWIGHLEPVCGEWPNTPAACVGKHYIRSFEIVRVSS